MTTTERVTVQREQLAFPLGHPSTLTTERFIPAPSNVAARTWLARSQWPDGRLWLWGPPGTGKTHLLTIWARNRDAPILDARDFKAFGEESHLPIHCDVAVDNADEAQYEMTLLHLLNDALSQGHRVLMAGRLPPSRTSWSLPDLASRLRATATTATAEPDDELRARLMLSLLADRQLIVSQSVMDWLWKHLPRTGSALVEAVRRLDAVALARGVAITRALAVEILPDLLQPDD